MNTTPHRGDDAMTEVFLTPTNDGAAIELSRTLFRKKILPKGTIDYKGRKIVFDDAYLTDLATAFHADAYDQTAFMLADKDNRHTMDPTRYSGEVKGVEVAEDGLYGTFELSADAAAMVKENPKLGVSARIVEGYTRSDGKTFPRAMQHVLGTLDPRIPGLGAWTEVALSGYDSSDTVLDLTAAEFERETTVASPEKTGTIDGLSEDEYNALLASLDLEDEVDAEEPEKPATAPVAEKAVSEKSGVSLSNEEKTAIDLANEQIAELKRARAEDAFKAAKAEYVRLGVPPALVELARPVLEAPDGFVLDLSNGVDDKKVDAGHIVRQMLDSAAGYIALAQERGHSVDFANESGDGEKDEDAEVLAMWAALDGDSK